MFTLTRRAAIASVAALGIAAADGHKTTFSMATLGSETDARSEAHAKVFAPVVSGFANNQQSTTGHWNILDIYSPDKVVSHVSA